MKLIKKMKQKAGIVTALAVALVPSMALAFTAPAAGGGAGGGNTIGYEIYNFVWSGLIDAGLGYVLAGIIMCLGFWAMADKQRGGVPAGIALFGVAAAMAQVSTIMTALGCLC